jgi:hypothetical protein
VHRQRAAHRRQRGVGRPFSSGAHFCRATLGNCHGLVGKIAQKLEEVVNRSGNIFSFIILGKKNIF